MTDALDDQALAVRARQIDEWLGAARTAHPPIEAVDHPEGDPLRWVVRMRGEEKEFTTVWLWLGQRTLRYETYVMPAPEAATAVVHEAVLRRNDALVGAHFSVGAEDAIYLRGALPVGALSAAELDRILGTLYALVERHFRALVRLGFPRLADR